MNASRPGESPSRRPGRGDDARTSRLVRGARGDRAGFGALYDRVAPALYAWAAVRIGPAARKRLDPEDLLQEVWCRAVQRFPDFDAERGTFRAWIFGIAHLVLLEGFRRLRTARDRGSDTTDDSLLLAVDDVPDEATSISRRVARDESVRSFLVEVGSLAEDDKVLLLSCGLEGLQHAEAAQVLGISKEAVSKRWQRLRARLKEQGGWEGLLA